MKGCHPFTSSLHSTKLGQLADNWEKQQMSNTDPLDGSCRQQLAILQIWQYGNRSQWTYILVLALKHPLLMQRMPRVYIPILAPYRRVTTATRVASVTADSNPRASLKVKNTCTCNSQYCIAPNTKKKAQHPDQSSTALPGMHFTEHYQNGSTAKKIGIS